MPRARNDSPLCVFDRFCLHKHSLIIAADQSCPEVDITKDLRARCNSLTCDIMPDSLRSLDAPGCGKRPLFVSHVCTNG
ncbi:hypothetical protein Ciccas_008750 [Cichlidogyrus casuarinus]|uniref:Uncharacterized protein n=1 Tax=Cichlidogyrus casuarinus TaxID=1844966 RepID=A0ABD2PZ02_9PLAT